MASSTEAWTWLGSGVFVGLAALGTAIAFGARPGARWRDLLLGAAGWSVSVGLKVAATVVIGLILFLLWGESPPLPATAAANGLLTGVFEVGITLLLVLLTRLREAPWNGALAFGVAFGCFEAAALSVAMTLTGLAGLADPASLDPEAAANLAVAFSHANRPGTFALERAVVVPLHALSCVLVVAAVRSRRAAPFWWAFALKTAVDAVPAEGEIPGPVLEGIWAAFGIASAAVLLRLRPWFEGAATPSPPAPRRT